MSMKSATVDKSAQNETVYWTRAVAMRMFRNFDLIYFDIWILDSNKVFRWEQNELVTYHKGCIYNLIIVTIIPNHVFITKEWKYLL